MSKSMQQWIEAENKVCAANYHPLEVVLKRGEGIYLWDITGKRYIDMMSAYSAASHGHCHPELVKVLEEQAKKLCITSRAFHNDTLKPFLEKLAQLSSMDQVLPMNTGAEAVETAIKACRKWGYEKKGIPSNKAEIIVASENFHGRTVTIISFSTDEEYKQGFGPFTPGFKAIPFDDADALEKAITENTCAFLVEPIQGEAGVNIPSPGYLKKCEAICKANNVLLVVDEIQSGLGRSGKWFAYEHDKVKPDGVILGKALGGGILPVSAFAANREIMDVFTPGTHGSTFGGNALASKVALRALELLEDGLVSQSMELGDYFLGELLSIKSPLIKAVRGKGLMIGLEVDSKRTSARAVCNKLIEKGILSKEAHETVIRFAPPLCITKNQLGEAINHIRATFDELG